MRKKLVAMLSLLMLSGGLTGCLAVSARDNQIGTNWAAVSIDDRIYLVNVTNGDMKRVVIPRNVPTINASRVEIHVSD